MLQFSVRSKSTGELYVLTATRTAGGVRFSCTCPAADNGTHCKHRISLLDGDLSDLASGNPQDVEALIKLVAGSPIEAALADVSAQEAVVEAAQKRLKGLKKSLATSMMG